MHEHADAQSLPVPGPRDSEDDRQRKLAALRTRLHEEAQAMRTPEDWARCLRLVARLPGETFANILLISAQRPGATILRGYDPWQAMGRQVSRQEQGIAIFSAVRRPGAGDPEPGPVVARCRTGRLSVGPFADQRPYGNRAIGYIALAGADAAWTMRRPVLASPARGIRGRAGARLSRGRRNNVDGPPHPDPSRPR